MAPSAKFQEVYKKTREIKSGPSNDDLLNVRPRPLDTGDLQP
jgi:hypothetical protein